MKKATRQEVIKAIMQRLESMTDEAVNKVYESLPTSTKL